MNYLVVSEVDVVYGACYERRLNEGCSPPCATPNVHIWVLLLLLPIHFSLCMANKEDGVGPIKSRDRRSAISVPHVL